jgi:hypothetical protein
MESNCQLDQKFVDAQRARLPSADAMAFTPRTQRLGPSCKCGIEPGPTDRGDSAIVDLSVGIGEVADATACGGGEPIETTRNGHVRFRVG